MALIDVIEFQGSPDLLVWKHPQENFNINSQLIVDPTYEALFVANGTAADLFGEGTHTLKTSNIPILKNLIQIPTGGKTPFPCKVYFINKVHQMDLLWGTKDAIPLEDPLYEIFLHVMIHGSLSYSIVDSRKFLLKLSGLRPQFTSEMLVAKFRGIIAKYVKDYVAKIMINGKLSYFMISANLMEISDVLQEKLSVIFEEYGVQIEFFNVESIAVPKSDYDAVRKAKDRRIGRNIEGYTWQEERQMIIAEKFAGNSNAMALGGTLGGVTGGMMMGTTISEIARNALQGMNFSEAANEVNPHIEVSAKQAVAVPTQVVNTGSMSATPSGENGRPCPNCGNILSPGAKFCSECGASVTVEHRCPNCGKEYEEGAKFCSECGTSLIMKKCCPQCGAEYESGTKFCSECGFDLR